MTTTPKPAQLSSTQVVPVPAFPWEPLPTEALARFPDLVTWQSRFQQKLGVWQRQLQVSMDQRISALESKLNSQ
jgi:hypothetical protein